MGMDSFQTGSGLADEVTFEIHDAVFRYDVKYNNGQTAMLTLSGKVDNKDFEESWPCGNDFIPEDGGKRLAHKSGEDKKINQNSAYGRFIDGFVACDGAMELLAKIDGADAFNAATWEGMTLHMTRQEKVLGGLKDEKTGEPVKSSRLVPDAIVAYRGASSATAAPAAKEAPAPPAIPADKLEQLTTLVGSSDNFESFIEAAYGVDGLVAGDYEDYVADQGDGGFYATTKAGAGA